MGDTVCVAAIAGAFGFRGEVRLKSFTAIPEDVAAYGPLSTEDGARTFEVSLSGKSAKGALVARLSGIASKEEADGLRGTRLHVERSRLPDLPEDEYYHADLIGLEVRDPGGAPLGRVAAVLNHGASDILEIRPSGGGASTLLAFTREAVPTVDLASGVIVADPPADAD